MAKKSNPRLIGSFVVGAIVLAIAGALAFGGGQFLAKKAPAVLFFEGSLAGLDVGAPVEFRGVKVGTVTKIVIQYDVANQHLRIPVNIEIDPDKFQIISGQRNINNIKTLVEKGLRAQLVVQSLVTGQAIVEFDFHPGTPIRLVGAEPGMMELPTRPSDMDLLKASVTNVLSKISKLPLNDMANQILDVLTNASDTLKSAQGLVANVNSQVNPLATSVVGTADQATATLKDAQARLSLQPGEPMANLNETLVSARKLAAVLETNVPPIASGALKLMVSAQGTLQQADDILTSAERLIVPSSPLYYELIATIREFKGAAVAIRIFAEYIQRNPNALLTGKH